MKYTFLILVISAGIIVMPTFYADATTGSYSAKMLNDSWQTKINKQVQIVTDVTNNQDRTQPFAYIVQVENQEGVVIQLSWLTGSLESGQSLSPSQSWTATVPGNYTAQIFVWAGIDNPDALSPPLNMKINAS